MEGEKRAHKPEQDRLCPRNKLLDGVCSCGSENNCGYERGYACFFPTATCLAQCSVYSPATERCACSTTYSNDGEASLVEPGEVCGNAYIEKCAEGCFYCFGTKCYVCREMYARSGGRCLKCPENCWKCKVTNDRVVCQKCVMGAEMNDGACTCVYGYDSEKKQCSNAPAISGSSFSNQVCFKSFHFNQQTGVCERCKIENCAICDSNSNTCDVCFTGEQNVTKCPKCGGSCSCVGLYSSIARNCGSCDAMNQLDGACKTCAGGFLLDQSQNCLLAPQYRSDNQVGRRIALTCAIVLPLLGIAAGVCAYAFIVRRRARFRDSHEFKCWFRDQGSAVDMYTCRSSCELRNIQ